MIEKLNVICFGAHPDDCEVKSGGIAAKWAAKGDKVKFAEAFELSEYGSRLYINELRKLFPD